MKVSSAAARRVRFAREFKRILARGKRIRGEYLQLYLLLQKESAETRLGVSLRRRLGSAVARNRSKRLVKEAFRVHRGQLPSGTDVIVAVSKDLSRMKLKEVEEMLSTMIARSGLAVEAQER